MFDKLIDVLISIIHWFRPWVICAQENAGFIRRFGLPVRDLKPGWNWVWPFVESSSLADMRVWADILPSQSLRTKDGVDMVVRLMVSHSVRDPRVFILKVYDANNNIQDVAAGQLGQAVMAATADEVRDGTVLRKVRRKIVTAAGPWGMTIHNVQFVDCAPAGSLRLFGVKDD
jgi:regulator of protease activity HflC (stomatin/prohibitin superfamily)